MQVQEADSKWNWTQELESFPTTKSGASNKTNVLVITWIWIFVRENQRSWTITLPLCIQVSKNSLPIPALLACLTTASFPYRDLNVQLQTQDADLMAHSKPMLSLPPQQLSDQLLLQEEQGSKATPLRGKNLGTKEVVNADQICWHKPWKHMWQWILRL